MPFLRIILYLENILCIYRCYTFCRTSTRRFILLRVLVEITFIFIFITILTIENVYTTIYIFFNFLNSVVILLSAINQGKLFMKFVNYFKSLDLYFPNNLEPTKKSEILQVILIIYSVTYSVVIFIVSFYYYSISVNHLNFYHLYYLFLVVLGEQRFIIESCVVCCAVSAIADQLMVIVKVIEKESFGINANTGEVNAVCEHATVTISHICKKRLRLFDTWSAAYATVRKCSELINKIFGFQIALMLSTVCLYYILLLYHIIKLSVKGEFVPMQKLVYTFILGEYVVALYLMAREAQRALNNAQILKRKLAALLLNSIKCEVQYKATRALLRQVAMHPIQTKSFGSVTVDMSLLPACLAFCVSYTVIALQYYKIV